jgi:hypothetical protein
LISRVPHLQFSIFLYISMVVKYIKTVETELLLGRGVGLIPICIQVGRPGLRPDTSGGSEEPIALAIAKHRVRTQRQRRYTLEGKLV